MHAAGSASSCRPHVELHRPHAKTCNCRLLLAMPQPRAIHLADEFCRQLPCLFANFGRQLLHSCNNRRMHFPHLSGLVEDVGTVHLSVTGHLCQVRKLLASLGRHARSDGALRFLLLEECGRLHVVNCALSLHALTHDVRDGVIRCGPGLLQLCGERIAQSNLQRLIERLAHDVPMLRAKPITSMSTAKLCQHRHHKRRVIQPRNRKADGV
mmetsp:Transcript_12037/g.28241  ORF Transcript_12037/g.28241 Transcript_12037/m.28241 type:complete len:211 (-) Transcript_12037:1030-1662(-)